MRIRRSVHSIMLGFLAVAIAACGSRAEPSPQAATPSGQTTGLPVSATATSQHAAADAAQPAASATVAQPSAPASATTTAAPPVTSTPAATAASAPTPTLAPTMPRIQKLVSGLDTPWAIDFAADGRAFITERPGRIRIVKDGLLLAEPWMIVPVAEVSEAGLLGLALDPQFAGNGFVYVAYTYRTDGALRNRLVRLREDPATGKGVFDRVLLDSVSGAANHDGGRVKFGPDGKLYWTMGDAQDAGLAQNRSSLNGKILRLDPDGAIPADNPFPGSPVYSFGHRNPQGLAWQPGTGLLFATEHGPSGGQGCCQDEINLIEPGKNYGWPVITGDRAAEGMVSPVIHSGTTETWAPSGMAFVTAGPWAGSLVFTGLRGQALYRLTLDPHDPRRALALERLFQGQFGRLRDVAQGPDGALYLLTSNADGRGNPGAEGDSVLRVTF